MKRMTVRQAKEITEPGFYRADTTLYLKVNDTGTKNWVQRLLIAGKRHDLGLGGFPTVSLEKARRAAFDNRVAIADGRDLLAERRKVRLPSFREAAEKTYETLKPRWRSIKVQKNWWAILERHAFKRIGDLPIDQVGREQVLSVLTPLWTSSPEMGRKLKRGINAVFQWGLAHGHIEVNVVDQVSGALPRQPAVKEHFRSLPYQEIPAALETIQSSGISKAAKLALRLLILTMCRSGEVRNAAWPEVDTDEKVWRIPGNKTKSGREHTIPLTPAMLEVLEQARALNDGSGLVFPSPAKPGRPMTDATLSKSLRACGLADRATCHGFRAAGRTFAQEKTTADHETMELALGHAVGNEVIRAYARSDLLAKRRRLFERYNNYLIGAGSADVTQLHG